MERTRLVKAGLAMVFLVISVTLLAGCGKGLQESDVSYAGPMLDNILGGIAARDYAQFSKDFSEKMKTAILEPDFDALMTDLEQKLGQYQERSFSSAVKAKNPAVDLMIVKYKAVYSKDAKVTITIYFSNNSGVYSIEGFLIDSPSLHQ